MCRTLRYKQWKNKPHILISKQWFYYDPSLTKWNATKWNINEIWVWPNFTLCSLICTYMYVKDWFCARNTHSLNKLQFKMVFVTGPVLLYEIISYTEYDNSILEIKPAILLRSSGSKTHSMQNGEGVVNGDRDSFHWRLFHRNSNSTEISFCSHPLPSKAIATHLGTWQSCYRGLYESIHCMAMWLEIKLQENEIHH